MADNGTISLPDGLWKQARAKAILEDENLSSLIRIWLIAWIDGRLVIVEDEDGEDEEKDKN